MYPVDRAFLLRYHHFRTDFGFNQDNLLDIHSDDSQLFAYTGLTVPAENKSFLFVASNQGLYLIIENGKLEEVKGIRGRTTQVK